MVWTTSTMRRLWCCGWCEFLQGKRKACVVTQAFSIGVKRCSERLAVVVAGVVGVVVSVVVEVVRAGVFGAGGIFVGVHVVAVFGGVGVVGVVAAVFAVEVVADGAFVGGDAI